MAEANEKRVSLKENNKYYPYYQNRKETDEIYWTHIEEGSIVKLNPHRPNRAQVRWKKTEPPT